MIFGNVSHPLFAANSKGFGVKVDPRFLSKTYCLWYAQSFLRLIHTRYSWWQGYTYKGMNQKHIAVELLAHAVLFYVDTGLLSSSRCAAEISQVLPKLILEEECRMVYIYLKNYPPEELKFDERFLPEGYMWLASQDI